MPSRILLLSANFGSGHLQAARSIAEACRELDPSCRAEAVNVDHPVVSLAIAGYLKLVEYAPGAYRSLYHLPVSGGVRSVIHSVFRRPVLTEIQRVRPDVVIATHPFPGTVAAQLRAQGILQAPVVIVVTDFAPHPLWIHEGVDRYFVASEWAAAQMASLGVHPSRISVVGIPIRPSFAEKKHGDLGKAAREVLVMGGGLGLGPMAAAVRTLEGIAHQDLNVTIVCGSNQELRSDLTEQFRNDPRIRVLGYTQNVSELMAGADLLVTKPGGLTCSEALASGLPMVLLSPLPGHEEENADYLCLTGAALAPRLEELRPTVMQLLFHRSDRLGAMRGAAIRAGRPRSATQIASEVLMGKRASATG